MLNTTKNILTWIHENLGEIHLDVANNIFKDYWITEAILAGIVCRETGFLIPKFVNRGYDFDTITSLMIGDGGHGRSYYQIDDRSYPDFVNSTPLSDVEAYCRKCIRVLQEKELSITHAGLTRESLGDELYEKAIIAAYNCGQGNVIKSLRLGMDVDSTTFSHDYAKSVMQYRYLYYDMFCAKENEADQEGTAGGGEIQR